VMIKNNNNTPYLRKKISSTLIALSTAIALLAMTSLPPLSNFLLQPAQAQSSLSFRTTEPAGGELSGCSDVEAILKFDAQGTPSSSDPQSVDITGGTFQVSQAPNSEVGPFMLNGNIQGGAFNNNTSGGSITMNGVVDYVSDSGLTCVQKGDQVTLETDCFAVADITFSSPVGGVQYDFAGAVECSPSTQGGDTTQSSMTGSTQDSDGDSDGIPDSSDRCANNSNSRCYIDAR
jgi:hypothetical protein